MKSEIIKGRAYNEIDGKSYNVSFDRYQKCPVCGKVRRLKNDELRHIVTCSPYGTHVVLIDCDDGHSRSLEEYLKGGCCAVIGVQCTVEEINP